MYIKACHRKHLFLNKTSFSFYITLYIVSMDPCLSHENMDSWYRKMSISICRARKFPSRKSFTRRTTFQPWIEVNAQGLYLLRLRPSRRGCGWPPRLPPGADRRRRLLLLARRAADGAPCPAKGARPSTITKEPLRMAGRGGRDSEGVMGEGTAMEYMTGVVILGTLALQQE